MNSRGKQVIGDTGAYTAGTTPALFCRRPADPTLYKGWRFIDFVPPIFLDSTSIDNIDYVFDGY